MNRVGTGLENHELVHGGPTLCISLPRIGITHDLLVSPLTNRELTHVHLISTLIDHEHSPTISWFASVGHHLSCGTRFKILRIGVREVNARMAKRFLPSRVESTLSQNESGRDYFLPTLSQVGAYPHPPNTSTLDSRHVAFGRPLSDHLSLTRGDQGTTKWCL